MRAWQPGDVCVLREFHLGRVWSGRPGRVVADEGERASFYHSWDTVYLWPTAEGESLYVPQAEWTLTPGRGLPYEQLHVMDVGAVWHASVLWRPDTYEHAGWKVDFHAPARRARYGFDALDWALDLMVAPDRTFHVKDEDQFAAYQERGLLSERDVALVRFETDVVIAAIEARTGPFADELLAWRPHPEWGDVEWPDDWDTAE